MTKTVKVDFFCDSKKWPRRVPKIKKITKKTIQNMQSYFKKNCLFSINLILSEKKGITKFIKPIKANQYQSLEKASILIFLNKQITTIKTAPKNILKKANVKGQ